MNCGTPELSNDALIELVAEEVNNESDDDIEEITVSRNFEKSKLAERFKSLQD